MKYDFNTLPPSVQKSCKTAHIGRIVTLVLSGILVVVLFISFLVSYGSKPGAVVDAENTLGAFIMAVLFGCMIHGIYISLPLLRSTFRKWSIVGIIPAVFIIGTLGFAGFGFAIVNVIRLICKKKLYYDWDIKYFLEAPGAQAEIEAEYQASLINALNGTSSSNSQTAMEDIQNLKTMLDQKLISQEEFEQKKTEILTRI